MILRINSPHRLVQHMFYAATTPKSMGGTYHRTPHKEQEQERKNNHQDTNQDIVSFLPKVN